jgi:hypothetical protein
MGLHVARVEPSKGERELALVLGGSVLLTYDGDLPSDLERLAAELWFLHSRDPETGPIPASVMEQFELWKTGLGGRSVQPLSDRGALSMIAAYTLPLPPTAPPPPPRPLVVFGHLPFSGSTGVGESYFRFEPWPTITSRPRGAFSPEHTPSRGRSCPFCRLGSRRWRVALYRTCCPPASNGSFSRPRTHPFDAEHPCPSTVKPAAGWRWNSRARSGTSGGRCRLRTSYRRYEEQPPALKPLHPH